MEIIEAMKGGKRYFINFSEVEENLKIGYHGIIAIAHFSIFE